MKCLQYGGLIREATWDIREHLFGLSLFATDEERPLLKQVPLQGSEKWQTPLQFQFNKGLRSAICFVFTMKVKYFPTARQWLFSHYEKIEMTFALL